MTCCGGQLNQLNVNEDLFSHKSALGERKLTRWQTEKLLWLLWPSSPNLPWQVCSLGCIDHSCCNSVRLCDGIIQSLCRWERQYPHSDEGWCVLGLRSSHLPDIGCGMYSLWHSPPLPLSILQWHHCSIMCLVSSKKNWHCFKGIQTSQSFFFCCPHIAEWWSVKPHFPLCWHSAVEIVQAMRDSVFLSRCSNDYLHHKCLLRIYCMWRSGQPLLAFFHLEGSQRWVFKVLWYYKERVRVMVQSFKPQCRA